MLKLFTSLIFILFSATVVYATPFVAESNPEDSTATQYGFCCFKDDILYFNIIQGGNKRVARAECVDLQNKSRTAECSPEVQTIINK